MQPETLKIVYFCKSWNWSFIFGTNNCPMIGKMETPVEVMGKLLLFTLLMCVLPIATYYISKIYFFEGIFQLPLASSCIYAAIPAVIVVNVVIGGFVYVAWRSEAWPTDDKQSSDQSQRTIKQDWPIKTFLFYLNIVSNEQLCLSNWLLHEM